jgi:anaerobic ribonucleoside-triphosphate reductase
MNNLKVKSVENEILKGMDSQRTRCLVYTRVMGYHRPVESFNIGKKGEHKERVQFNECRN